MLSSDFLISVIHFPLAPKNISIFLSTEFAFLFGLSYLFFSLLFLRRMRETKMVSGREENGLKSGRTEELFSILHTIPYDLIFPFSFSLNCCLYLPFSLCSLYLCTFMEFSAISKTTFKRGTGRVVQVSTITSHKSESIPNML